MDSQQIGILHPGEMGVSIAASARNSGHSVFWASEGRGQATRARAEKQTLIDRETLAALCRDCAILISVCPPGAAETVANSVLSHSFAGLYVDANAIAPQRSIRIGQTLAAAGIRFVDGAIIGGPAWSAGSTMLYLAGEDAGAVAALFSAGPLTTHVLGTEIGTASALKMCYAAYTKGTTALLCGVLGAAETLGVREALIQQWTADASGLAEEAPRRVRDVTAKAWRFAGEMEEISATFQHAGMPGEFHAAAAVLYQRLAGFKDAPEKPSLETVLNTLRSE